MATNGTMMIIRRRVPCGRPMARGSKNVRSKTEKGRRGHMMKYHSDNDHRQGLNHNSLPSMGTMSIEHNILLHLHFGPRSFATSSDEGDTQQQRAATTSNSSFSRLDDEEDERPFARNRNEWAVPYLDFFAESILQNVREVVGNWGGDDSKSLDSRTRGRILLKRWNVAYDKEREIYHRQIAWSKMKSTRPQKNTVVELWDDALQSIGISSSILNATEAMNNPLLPSHETLSHAGGEQDDTIMCDTTPLFGLAVDENFYIRDLETILLSDQDSVEQNLSSGDLPISDSHDIRERQLHLQSDSVNSVNNGDKYSIYQDAILRAVALLSATKPNDWIKFDSSHSPIESADDNFEADETHSRMDSPAGEGHLSDIDLDETVNAGKHELGFGDASSMLRGFLQEALDRRHAATTFEANLCLAYLTTSTSLEADTILERCLQIFNEMVMVADSGQHECQPDSFTYRLLLLSFNRRLMAQGEAIKLCQRLIKEETSSILTPEAFMEAIKTCQAKMDLSTANMMMELALTKRIQQPSVGACMVFVDMMKAQQRRDDSLAFFARVQHAHILSKEDEEKLLLSLCRWPNRTRRSHYIDLASFLLNILSTVEQKVASGEKLGLPLWTTLLEGLYKVAKVDHSQMQNIAGALRILLDADPHRSPGRKLTWIGLEVAEALGDSKLAAAILRQAAETRRLPTSIGTSSSRNRHITNFNESPNLPHQAMKIGLDICLKQGDAESAEAISEILEQLRDTIPTATQKELFSTILLCHTRVGDADKAKLYLQTLIAKGMSPGEDLYGAVIHSLAAIDRYEEADELFGEMEIPPGVTSFDAILLSRIRARSWESAIALYETMKEKMIPPSAQTIQGLLLVHYQRGGRPALIKLLDSLVANDGARLDESAFRLTSKILFREVENSLEDFRQHVRDIGEQNTKLRQVSLNLVRSIRVAEIESNRLLTAHRNQEDMQTIRNAAWSTATSHLLDIVRATSSIDTLEE